jgi:hypothetical protein
MPKTLSDFKPGDTVYVSRQPRSIMADTYYMKGKLVKVTPSGMADVKIGASENATRFNKDGYEVGGDPFYGYHLELDAEKVEKELAYRAARFAARTAANNVASLAETLTRGHEPNFLLDTYAQLKELIKEAEVLAAKAHAMQR